jgi:hypothetical protein
MFIGPRNRMAGLSSEAIGGILRAAELRGLSVSIVRQDFDSMTRRLGVLILHRISQS